MCGIAGIVYSDRNAKVEEDVLREMTMRLVHRGPDDFGLWIDGAVGFGHQRLSVIDIDGGHQPMTLADNRCYITYNGEIYNYLELRRKLEHSEFAFKTQSDTEVLLKAYVEYGEDSLHLLNGMFAFAVWDPLSQRLFAARDRLGIKPFYYYWDGSIFLFASEIKSLLTHPKVEAQVDFEHLPDYLDLQYCLGDSTLFKGVKRLAPGHSLMLSNGQLSIKQYWEIEFRDTDSENASVAEEIRELITDSVRIRLRSDVPVGAHLSGGMDSSTVATLASSMLDDQLSVFTGGFRDNQRYDESHHAKLVADQIGANYYEVFPTASDLSDSFENLIYYLDEPVAGAAVFPQYFLSQLASKHVKVVLGGQGGDEIFCGYARYLIAYLESCLKNAIYPQDVMSGDRYTSKSTMAEQNLSGLVNNLPYLRGYEPMIMNFFAEGLFSEPAERYYRLLKRSDGVHEVVSPDFYNVRDKHKTLERFKLEFERPESGELIDCMMYFDVKNHLQSLLHLEDRTSMAVSLESRLPLLDYRIIELLCRTPANDRFAKGKPKALLKEAVSDILPKQVVDRRDKMGFPVPIFEWFKGELRPFVEDILLGETTRNRGVFIPEEVERCLRSERPYGRTVWGLLSLELWFRCFFDQK